MGAGGPGTVYLVGAGPGDPDLVTLRGVELLARADVVIYDGLANPVLLDHAPPGAEKVYAGKKHSERGGPLTQGEINDLLIARARAGRSVVRLKGGDPFVFGRGGEEAEALAAAGVPFEVVPGVTAASAVPAYAGIPLTHRGLASTAVVLATGHDAEGKERAIDWAAAARADTVVLFMAVKTLGEIAGRLIAAGRDAATPAAAIRWGTTAAQRTVVGTLGDIAARVDEAALKPPALVVIGEVVRLRERLAWFERRPLFGARVLVPRQREQARGFARALVALGAEPVICEVTRLEEADRGALDAALAGLPGAYDWIAFASGNAAERTIESLLRAGRDARAFAGTRIAAVGEATAEALRRRGIAADLVPDQRDAAGLAAAILRESTRIKGTPSASSGAGGLIPHASDISPPLRVLLPRAEEGREELAEALTAAGARVTAVAAYRTVPAPAADLEPILARLRAGEIDVLTFFAPSQIAAILGALGPDGGAAATLNRARSICAIGATTAAAAVAAGVRVDLVPPAPSADALAAALVAHYRRP